MKITFLLHSLFLLCVALMMPAYAAGDHRAKVVLHLSNQHKLHVLVNNVKNIREAYGDKVDIVVVVNGPAVTRFGKLANSNEQVREILHMRVDLQVCSSAMRFRDLPPEQLIEGVTYLKQGGVVRLIELQQQGYAYIKI